MAKPGYTSLRLTDDRRAALGAICDRIGIDSAARGSLGIAVDYALHRAVAERSTTVTNETNDETNGSLPSDPTARVEALRRLAEDAHWTNSRAYSLEQARDAGMSTDAYIDWLVSEAALDVETRTPRITDRYDLQVLHNAMARLVNA
jgi:hypothetical protein